MIEVEGLSKRFATRIGRRQQFVTALAGLDFAAPDGAITALLGPNGAGKTTALRIVATLMQADAGSARVGGFDVARDPLAVRASLGVLSDARGLYGRLTARENIAYYARLRGLSEPDWRQRLEDLATLLDMRTLLERPTAGFSTGEKMKVALARALIHDPQHLILDEPTNGLDVPSTRALRRLLRHLRERGKCIIFSSHIMQEVSQLADGIVVVAHGRALATGTAATLTLEGESLEDAFVRLAFAEAT
ncbi:MAG: ATP-binding cassette domain-containing protein [Burkholderiaceae bacterium]